MTKRIDPATLPVITGTLYPSPFDSGPCRSRRRTDSPMRPGLRNTGSICCVWLRRWSSQRHWHTHQDEFIYVVLGEVVLATDTGGEILRAGDSAGFKAGDEDGHHFPGPFQCGCGLPRDRHPPRR